MRRALIIALAALCWPAAAARAQGAPEGVVLAHAVATQPQQASQAPAGAESPAAPKTRRGMWYSASEAVLILGHALDTGYSQRLLGTGCYVETSPLLGQFHNPGVFVGVKFAMGFGQLKATREIARAGHPLVAAVANAAVGGVMAGAALHNGRLYRDYSGRGC